MKTIISYHPISEKEIHNWYYNIDFSLILDDVNYSLIKTARASNVNDEHLKIHQNNEESCKNRNGCCF